MNLKKPHSLYSNLKSNSAVRITLISLFALLLAHLVNLGSIGFLLLGVIITSGFIYYHTLLKKDRFSFIMVMYFCSTFPYLVGNGGAFNLVSFMCIGIDYILRRKIPSEKRVVDPYFNWFVGLFILSSILGWILNFAGTMRDLIYSACSFFGVIFLLLVSSSLLITPKRINVFLQLNFILIIYSLIASINVYYNFFPFTTPMMPVYQGGGSVGGYFEAGGILGVSPFYGEHSMILAMLFSVFAFLGKNTLSSYVMLLLGIFISFLNIFMSISRSVFLLSLVGVILISVFQYKLVAVKFSKQVQQILLVLILGYGTLWAVERYGLGFVFERVGEIEEINKEEGGITFNRVINGSAFNREAAFREGYKRYASKNTWLIGYGWGLLDNNRIAHFVDPNIKRGGAHSQIFSSLFLFGWIGFIAYWGLIFRIIYRSYRILGNRKVEYSQRLFAYFSMVSLCLFVFNEIKVDSLYFPSYFAVTIIWLGLAYSTQKYFVKKSSHMPTIS